MEEAVLEFIELRPLLPGQGCPGDQLLLFTARAGMPWGPVHSSNHSPFLGPQAIPGLAVCLLSFPGPQAIPGLALRLLVLAFHCQGRDAWPGRRPFGPQAIPGLAVDAFDSILTTTHEARRSPPHRWRRRG